MKTHIAIQFSRLIICVLGDVPPSMPPRGGSLASVFVAKARKAEDEHRRCIRHRYHSGLPVRVGVDRGQALLGSLNWRRVR